MSAITEILRKLFVSIPWAFITALAITVIIYMNMSKETEPIRKELIKAAEQATDSVTTRILASDTTITADADQSKSLRDTLLYLNREAAGKTLIEKAKAKAFPWPYYLLALAVLALLVFLYVTLNRMQLAEQYIKDRDPDELRQLFKEHSYEIGALGTPRSLKRFSNRLRFQYNLLKISRVIKTSDQADFFFRIMIKAEKHRSLFLESYEDFSSKLDFKTDLPENEVLLKKLYEYNKNILI